MADEHTSLLRIDIISDVMCPWCIVGYKQLEHALGSLEISAGVAWHPFELNPNMPAEGQDLREHMAEKYGSSPEDSEKNRANLIQLGKQLGIEFNYSDNSRMWNTFLAHQLLYWAQTKEKQHLLKMELFSAHFTRGLNLGDTDVLVSAASAVGLDKNEALAVLTDGRYAQNIRQEQQFWAQKGIQGVPAMIFNQRHLVTGAQGVENYVSILKQLTSAPESQEDVKA